MGSRVGPGTETRRLRHYPATGTPGFYPYAPNRPSSMGSRLILDVNTLAYCCFSTPEVFNSIQVQRVPTELQAKGIDQETWKKAINTLEEAVQEYSVSYAATMLAAATILPSFFCMPFMYRSMNQVVGEAQDKLNREIFEPKGLYIKTQKSVVWYKKDRWDVSWLTIALTPAESAILKEEPHIYGYDESRDTHIPNSEACCPEMEEWCGVPIVI